MADDERSSACEATQEFIEEHADGDTQIRAVLETDAAHETWEFDDVAVDSGVFGEIVSRGIVEKVDGQYRLADHDGVYEALHGEQPEHSAAANRETGNAGGVQDVVVGEGTDRVDTLRSRLRSAASVRNGIVVLGLLFVGLMRSVFHYGDVFRNGTVVLPGNDPYRRRYWLEQLVHSDLQPWNPLDLGSLPEFVTTTETLFFWLTWTAAAILGNSTAAVSTVLTWYPVVTAMLTGLAVYALALRVSGDVRIGVASIFMLAVIPIHASYTALGMGDHHALDHLLLTLIVWMLVVTVDGKDTLRIAGRDLSATRAGTVGFGVALAGLNVAWEGAALWFAGVGLVLWALVVQSYDQDRSPLAGAGPVLGGVALATGLTLAVRFGFGWLQPYRVVMPVLLLVGTGVVVAAGEAGFRRELPSRLALPVSTLLAGAVVALSWVLVPPFSENVAEFWEYLQRTAAENITETLPLFTTELQVVGGPISYLGGVFVLAVPALALLTRAAVRNDSPGWLVVTVFCWYVFAWALVQIRFTAELAPFFALFAGVGFVYVLSWISLLSPPRGIPGSDEEPGPTRRDPGSSSVESGWDVKRGGYVVAFFLFVAVFSFIFIPSFMSDITVADDTYETAEWISEYSDEQGLEYPDNYVFSPWSENRQYNYYVNGESDSYGFARRNYEEFLGSSDPDGWYPELSSRAGFVVTQGSNTEYPPSSTGAILHDRFGSYADGVPGAAHYRARYVTEDRTRAVFELVPGARLTGIGAPNETVRITTEVDLGRTMFTYERQVRTNRYGDYGVTVPYAGEYEFPTDQRAVAGDDVVAGRTVGTYRAHWTLDEGSGDTIADPVGEQTATVEHATWVDGVGGSALQFDGEGATVVPVDPDEGMEAGSFAVSLWVNGDISSADAELPTVLYRTGNGSYGFWTNADRDQFGFHVEDADGVRITNYGIGTKTFDEWTMVTGVVDRERSEVRLYRNETLVQTVDASGLGDVETRRFAAGGRPWGQYTAVSVDQLRFYATALDGDDVESLYERSTPDG